MVIRGCATLWLTFSLIVGLVGGGAAEVRSVTPGGFEVSETVMIQAPAERVYGALGEIDRWWSPDHTFSRDAGNLSIELRAGGCFCERLKGGGSARHLTVVYAAPAEGVRLRGALGPLQMEGADGVLIWALKSAESGTNVTQSYVVGGYIRGGADPWAPRVDRVLREQLSRLKRFVETGSPK